MKKNAWLIALALLAIVGCKQMPKRTTKAPPLPPPLPNATFKRLASTEGMGNGLTSLEYLPSDFALTSIRVQQRTNVVLTWQNGTPPFQPQVKTNILGAWVDYGPSTTLRQITNRAPTSTEAFFRVRGTGGLPTGQFQWASYMTGPTQGDVVQVNSVKADSSGNILVAGAFSGTINFGGITRSTIASASMFVAKFSPTGTLLWVNTFGDNAASSSGVAVDGAGNVVVVGSFSGVINFGAGLHTSAGSDDIFVAKFSASGQIIWSQRFGGAGSDAGFHVGIDSGNNVILSGWFGFGFVGVRSVDFGGGPLTSAGNYDIFIVKLTSGSPSVPGFHVWSKRWGGTQLDEPKSLAVDASGDVIYGGHFSTTADYGDALTSAGDQDIALAKYSGVNGNRVWTKRFGGTLLDAIVGVAVDGNREVVLTGGFRSTINFGGATFTSEGNGDIYLAKLGATGNHVWSTKFIAGQTGNDGTRAVAVDNQNNIVISGATISAISLGGDFLIPPSGVASIDTFLAKYNPTGAHQWSKRYGGNLQDFGFTVTTDASRNVVLGGTFFGSMQFGGAVQVNSGGNDGYVAKFSP